jgi:hypothetical protein
LHGNSLTSYDALFLKDPSTLDSIFNVPPEVKIRFRSARVLAEVPAGDPDVVVISIVTVLPLTLEGVISILSKYSVVLKE